MDIRIRKMKAEESSAQLSRSLPTSRTFPVTNKTSCFQRCLNVSTDSLNSNTCRSPKLGHYRKLPNQSECDICHVLTKDVSHLKCFHSVCGKCFEKWKIEQTACPVCMNEISDSSSSTYDNHHSVEDLMFDDLDLDKETENIDDLIRRVEFDVLKGLKERHNELLNEQTQLIKDADEQINKINDHVKNLKSLIDKKAESLIKLVKDSRIRHMKELEQKEEIFNEFIKQVENSVRQYKATENNTEELKQRSEDLVRQLARLSEQIATENIHIRYNVKPVTDNVLDVIVGKVGVRVFLEDTIHAVLQQTHVLPAAVTCICPVNAHQAWVGFQTFIQLCSKNGYRAPAVDLYENIQDACVDENGDVLVACESSVKLVKNNVDVRTLFVCDNSPLGIACTKDGTIVMCIKNKVVLYNKQGEIISELQGNGLGDMKVPYKVATNVNGDICVTDFQSVNGGVAIFNSSGHVLARIRTDGMAPRGITCSHQGLIYVCDFRADRINVYSAHGHFLRTVATASHGLSGPLSAALDPSGDLWVGDWKRKVRIFHQTVEQRPSDVIPS